MGDDNVARPDRRNGRPTSRDHIRSCLEQGTLNLVGVAAALRAAAKDIDEEEDRDVAAILYLLAQDVDREAAVMAEGEAFLNGRERGEAR